MADIVAKVFLHWRSKIFRAVDAIFRVKMWGTSSPDDKLADDLGNAIEGTRISGCQSDFFTAGKLASGNLGLLQQYRHGPEVCRRLPRMTAIE
jgi:hypothetical protein